MPTHPNILRKVARVSRELSTGFDAQLKTLGLTSARARVMLLLGRTPDGVSQASVTDFLGVEHPTAVRILDGLETLGHIRREPALNDRRAKLIVLTDLGRPVARQVEVLTEKVNAQLLDGLNPAEVLIAERMLDTLLERIVALKSTMTDDAIAEDVL